MVSMQSQVSMVAQGAKCVRSSTTYEPLKSEVVVHLRRLIQKISTVPVALQMWSAHVSKDVSQANTSTHCGKNEGESRRPLVTAIVSCLRLRAEDGLEQIFDRHHSRSLERLLGSP